MKKNHYFTLLNILQIHYKIWCWAKKKSVENFFPQIAPNSRLFLESQGVFSFKTVYRFLKSSQCYNFKVIEEMKIKSFQIKPTHEKLIISDYKSIYNEYKACALQKRLIQSVTPCQEKFQNSKRFFSVKPNTALNLNKSIIKDLNFLKIQKISCIQRRRSNSMLNLYPIQKQNISRQKTAVFQINFTPKLQKTQSIKIRTKQKTKSKSIQTSFHGQYEPIDNMQILATQIYQRLCQKQVIQSKGNFSLVKRQKFIQFIAKFTKNLTFSRRSTPLFNQDQPELQLVFKKARNEFEKLRLNNKKLGLSMKSKNVQIKLLLNNEFNINFQDLHADIVTATAEKKRLEAEIKVLTQQLQHYSQNYSYKQKELSQLQRQIEDFKRQISNEMFKYKEIKRKTQYQQSQYQKIRSKIQEIEHFVQRQQEKRVLHWVSEAYKQIQGQICDYASYLRCNAMASCLTWEPKPFSAVEKWINQQEKKVCKSLDSQNLGVTEKSAKMKEFVLTSMRKFKNKDEQMTKMTEFKTECIRKFIKMMQKWMQNWQLKQEYLVGLRSEFAVDSKKINDLLTEQAAEQGTKKTHEGCVAKLKDFRKVWERIELNYKYGNSFY